MNKQKLTKEEKKLLRRKLLHGQAYGAFVNRVAFNKTERLILDSAEEKVGKKLRSKKEEKK
jgi:hypothetical protein